MLIVKNLNGRKKFYRNSTLQLDCLSASSPNIAYTGHVPSLVTCRGGRHLVTERLTCISGFSFIFVIFGLLKIYSNAMICFQMFSLKTKGGKIMRCSTLFLLVSNLGLCVGDKKPQKVAILGGGAASCTTALALTGQSGWKERYNITIYILGWETWRKSKKWEERELCTKSRRDSWS